MEVFGPIQSRRLGLSLGINHLPPKICTYSCVYCQLGRTSFMTTNRASFSDPQEVFQKIKQRLEELSGQGIHPDTITFVSNGEPTLDKSLGEMIQLVKVFGIQTAVITNASLLWHPDTCAQLSNADIVSLKIDSVIEDTWHKIDRPHGNLRLDMVFKGIHWFAQTFKGRIITETMLIKDINDTQTEAEPAADFIADLHPETAYLALPLRPPAESWVHPPTEERLMAVYQIFKERIPQVELLMDLPETELFAESDPVQSLLNTLQVHPLSKNEIKTYLDSNHLSWMKIEELIKKNILKPVLTNNKEFFIRTY
jgi:wyosine [tRNA(Phe)-imidazoG37] synthetase (radical SAM superfamily)